MAKVINARILPSLAICLLYCGSALSQSRPDSSYFSLALGNQWTYRSSELAFVDSQVVVDTQRADGKLYFGIAGNSGTQLIWARQQDAKVYIAPSLSIPPDSSHITEAPVYDFSADVAEEWDVFLQFEYSLFNCDYSGTISLAGKHDTVTTPFGVFENCFAFVRNPPCSDAGLLKEWFAPSVGRVAYNRDHISGVKRFALTKAILLTSISHRSDLLPVTTYQVLQNYPNPFNPTTLIRFTLPHSSQVKLSVYNLLGQEIALLFNGRQEAGTYEVRFDGSPFASGIYYYRLQTTESSQIKQMILLR